MNLGKVSESIYKRTIYKTVQTMGYHDIEKIDGAGLGADCAIFTSAFPYTAEAVGSASGKDPYLAARAVTDACNKIAAYGIDIQQKESTKVQILLNIFMSEDLREAKLREMLEIASTITHSLQIEIANVDCQIIPGMDHQAAVTATAVANTKKHPFVEGNARPEQDIVMTKWMAMEGTAILANRKKEELATRYPLNLIEEAEGFKQYLSVIPEAAIAAKSDVSAMQVVRDGGIFGGLWALAQKSGVGLVVDLKKIAIKQETIEISEFFDINPYKLLSGGNLLLTTDKGAHLVTELKEAGIQATIIGRTTKDHDRVIVNEEETRFLEPARGDEIFLV